MGRHPDDKWDDFDKHTVGENYEMNQMRLYELGLSITLGGNGQVVAIKNRVSRGHSETLYKWTGDPPQAPKREGSLH